MRFSFVLLLLACTLAARADHIAPTDNLVVENIPAIEQSLAARVAPYTEFRAKSFVGWHPKDRAMLVAMRATNSVQLHLLREPGGKLEQLTDFREPVSQGSFEPVSGKYLVFARDNGGDEAFQLFRLDFESKAVTPLSPAGRRAGAPAWRKAGERIAFTTVPLDSNRDREAEDTPDETIIHVMDPMEPASIRSVGTVRGASVFNLLWSEDGKSLYFSKFFSSERTELLHLDIESGKISAVQKGVATGSDADVEHGGKYLWVSSNRGTEFRTLTRVNPVSGERERFLQDVSFDVERLAVSENADAPIAFVTNEDGVSRVRLFDRSKGKERTSAALASLGRGVVGGLKWRRSGQELALSLTSATSPGEVWSYDPTKDELVRWTLPDPSPLDVASFAEPQVIRWKSFDGRDISGLLYVPRKASADKPLPVLISIHGGPESQAKPAFQGRTNFLINELGMAVILPNVRGSTGFGKTFAKLDNAEKREDSVKDISALLDWIATQPQLDAKRVAVAGGSYGGYMSLAVAVHESSRIAGAIDRVGISHFATFLKNTETYRRDRRRAEYGDERDPKMREVMERISPLSNAHKIGKPLFVIQGRNDPRVPWTEAVQIRDRVKQNQVPVWFLMANDEGHGFKKKKNADFQFYSEIKFLQNVLAIP